MVGDNSASVGEHAGGTEAIGYVEAPLTGAILDGLATDTENIAGSNASVSVVLLEQFGSGPQVAESLLITQERGDGARYSLSIAVVGVSGNGGGAVANLCRKISVVRRDGPAFGALYLVGTTVSVVVDGGRERRSELVDAVMVESLSVEGRDVVLGIVSEGLRRNEAASLFLFDFRYPIESVVGVT